MTTDPAGRGEHEHRPDDDTSRPPPPPPPGPGPAPPEHPTGVVRPWRTGAAGSTEEEENPSRGWSFWGLTAVVVITVLVVAMFIVMAVLWAT